MEYALIIGLISIVAILVLLFLGNEIAAVLSQVGEELQ